jgi:predicted nucleotidyltransferase
MGTHSRSVAGALFGRARLAVLGVLFEASAAPLRLREIVRRARVGTGAVQRELERLRAAGLVVRQRRGREVHFQVNRAAPVAREVEALVQRLATGPRSGGVRDPLLRQHRDAILAVARRHGVTRVRVFGSRARGTGDEASDVDLLVDLEPGRSLLDLGAVTVELREVLGRRVDVVTERGLRPRIREEVLRDAVPL